MPRISNYRSTNGEFKQKSSLLKAAVSTQDEIAAGKEMVQFFLDEKKGKHSGTTNTGGDAAAEAFENPEPLL